MLYDASALQLTVVLGIVGKAQHATVTARRVVPSLSTHGARRG